jgi:hypothetical protein
MGSKIGGRAQKTGGIISDDMIHRIDTMNDEDDSDNKPYLAKRKTQLDDDQLFDDKVYNDEDEENDKFPIGVVIAVIAIVVIAILAVIVFIK